MRSFRFAFAILLLPVLPGILRAGGYGDGGDAAQQPAAGSSNFYIQLNASALFASLIDWKNQIYTSGGSHPSTSCTVFGLESGVVLNRYFVVGAGYEYFFAPSATGTESSLSVTDQVSGSFFYGSLRAGIRPESIPELYISLGIDAGTMTASESLQLFIGNYDRSGSSIAERLKLGVQYYATPDWSLSLEGGYLFGKVKNITGTGVLQNYIIDFSGIEFRGGVSYHIPL